MRVILQVVGGPHDRQRFVLSRGQSAVFGRTPQADYQMADDPLMSGTHFAIELDGHSCQVRDLDSRNGTFVNDKRVMEQALVTGSVIKAGGTQFSVTLENTAGTTKIDPSILASLPAKSPPSAPLPGLARPGTAAASPQPSGLRSPAAPPQATLPAPPRELAQSAALREYEQAMGDADPIVRRNALLAAAWKGQKWVLEYCRTLVKPVRAENREALMLLAIIGQPEDLPRVMAIGRAAELGPFRFSILGAYGHPRVMADVLAGIESGAEATAAAAGAAFSKITGIEVTSSEVESELLLPDPQLAMQEWWKLKAKFDQGQRWCRGMEVSRALPPEALEVFDLESRWEACLRGRFMQCWTESPLDQEQLADKLASE